MLLCQGTVLNVSSIPSRPDYILYPPVTSSLTSASIDFLNSRSKAGIPPTFFIAILFSSVDLPNTRFRRAPQAFFWTSKTLWSKRSTRCLIPPSLYTWNEKNPRPEGYAVNWWLHKSVRVRSWDRHTCWKFEGYSLRWRSFPVLRLKEKGDLGDRPLHTGHSHIPGVCIHTRPDTSTVWVCGANIQTQHPDTQSQCRNPVLDLLLQATLFTLFSTWNSLVFYFIIHVHL